MVNKHPENAPPSEKHKKKLKDALLDGTLIPSNTAVPESTPSKVVDTEETITTEPDTPTLKPTHRTVTQQEAIKVLFPSTGRETVELITEVGTFNFKVDALEVQEFSIGFMLQDDTFMNLVVGAALTIKIRRQTYNVVYVGGSFKFKAAGCNLVTFLLASEDK